MSGSPLSRGARAACVGFVAAAGWVTACGTETTSPDPRGNRAPLRVDAIPALDLPLRQIANLDVAPYYRDPDGDALTFTARSPDPGVARASVSGNVLTLEGVARGTVHVAVTATDPDGLAATQRFEVTVGAALAFTFGVAQAREGGSAFLDIVLGEPAVAPLTVRYALGVDDSRLTDDADAADYLVSDSDSVTVPAGASEARIEIAIAQDDEIEPPREVLTVALERPESGTGYVLASPAAAVVVIREGVCDRTPAVRDGIVKQLRADACSDPDQQDLAGLATLALGRTADDPVSDPGDVLSALRQADFSDLTGLEWLSLAGQRLTRLPTEIFAELSSLEVLNLAGNDLAELPPGVFSGLRRLQWLSLFDNRLEELPSEVFAGLAALKELYLGDNELTALRPGVFSRLWSLERLGMAGNPVTFAFTVELARTDDDAMAGGPVTLEARLLEGAPFSMSLPLWARRGTLSADSVRLPAGARSSASVTLTPDEASEGPISVTLGTRAALSQACLERCDGFDIVAGDPLVVANPGTVEVSVATVYLTQATQDRDGGVPLVAGRRALLRAFATGDEVNSFRPGAHAVFFRGEGEIHRVALESPAGGIPRDVDESRLDRSFNAVIPGDVLEPGVSLVVELDSAGATPLAPSSRLRFPAEGRHDLDVREVPPLRVTLVPVQYLSEDNRDVNDGVADFAAELAAAAAGGGGSPRARSVLRYARTVLPVRDLEVALREPYFTWADTTADGVTGLLAEVELLRMMEARDAGEHYSGIFGVPVLASRHPDAFWIDGQGLLGGRTSLTGSHDAEGRLQKARRLQLVFAHELGHNLGRPHTPCDDPVADPGQVDADYPHARGTLGAWGHNFGEAEGPGLGHLFDPGGYRDLMSYCHPQWISDYSFKKMLEFRDGARLASAGVRPDPAARRETVLLLWGGIRGGGLRLEPAFVHEAPTRPSSGPGPYRLSGLDAAGRRLFSFSFAPQRVDDANGAFAFAIPFDPSWTEALDRLRLSGPEGAVTLDRAGGGRAVLIVDRATGRVRSIARDGFEALPSAPDTAGTAVKVIRGLPRSPTLSN